MTTPPSAESPAVARRRLRLALRRAREEKGFTQHQVAEEMEWSISKVMRIESGEVTVSVNDTRSLLTYLGITDSDEVSRDDPLEPGSEHCQRTVFQAEL